MILTHHNFYAIFVVGGITLKINTITLATLMLAILFVSPALVLGQPGTRRLTSNEAKMAWESVSLELPVDTPIVTGGGLITERQINGSFESKIWFIFSQPGIYLFVGNRCDGSDIKISDLYAETMAPGNRGSAFIFDQDAYNRAFPYSSVGMCAIGVIRMHQGRVERSVTQLISGRSQLPRMVVTEGINVAGRYFLSINIPLPANTVVILGRTEIATSIQAIPGGTMISFRPDVQLASPGPMTLTFCGGVECDGITFDHRLEVGGKG